MEKELKFDYDEELKKFCITKGIWDDKNQKPIGFVINRLKTVEKTNPDGYTYKENVFDGFTTKQHKFKIELLHFLILFLFILLLFQTLSGFQIGAAEGQ